MATDLNRLLGVLNTSGLQSKDTPLYQVISGLINSIRDLQNSSGSGSSGGSGGGGTVIENFPTTFLGMIGQDGQDGEMGPPGISGGSSLLLAAWTKLTNAQIKALPTTPITLIPAFGSGFRTKLIAATFFLDSATGGGLYTNIDATYASLQIETSDGAWLINPLVNDNSTISGITKVSDFLGISNRVCIDISVPLTGAETQVAGEEWIQAATAFTDSMNNKLVRLAMDNNGTGNLTGGNAANYLLVRTYYLVEAVTQ